MCFISNGNVFNIRSLSLSLAMSGAPIDCHISYATPTSTSKFYYNLF